MTSRSKDSWGWGFACGFLCALALVVAFVYGQRKVHAAPAHKTPPKHWIDTALKIGACEQPSGRKGKWAAVNWKNETNYSFKGGLGMTNALWDEFKLNGYPEDAHQATPMEQIIVAWRFYNWAERTYPSYGWTGWECSEMIGFYGFNNDGTWK